MHQGISMIKFSSACSGYSYRQSQKMVPVMVTLSSPRRILTLVLLEMATTSILLLGLTSTIGKSFLSRHISGIHELSRRERGS